MKKRTATGIDPKKIEQKHTHVEIFPSAILGVGVSIIHPEHNQSPRNTESAMAAEPWIFNAFDECQHLCQQHFMLTRKTSSEHCYRPAWVENAPQARTAWLLYCRSKVPT
jgi:hypothetical protein